MDPHLAKLVREAVAKAQSQDGQSEFDAESSVEANLVPHEGIVFCDRLPSGVFVVCNILTGEKKQLPAGCS